MPRAITTTGSRGTTTASAIPAPAATRPRTSATTTIGRTTRPATSRSAIRSMANGSHSSRASGSRIRTTGNTTRPATIPKTRRNGRSSSQIIDVYQLLTSSRLEKFRRSELIGGPPGRCRQQVNHRTVAQRLVQALDDRSVAGGLLQLREADDDAEADEEHENEHGAGPDALKRADRDLHRVTHARPRPRWTPAADPEQHRGPVRGALPPWPRVLAFEVRTSSGRSRTSCARRGVVASRGAPRHPRRETGCGSAAPVRPGRPVRGADSRRPWNV